MSRTAQTCRCPRRPQGARTLVYHGAHHWEGPPEVRPQTQKNTAHGPGIYGTTARSTAARYAKGGGTVLLLDLKDPIRWLDEAGLRRAYKLKPAWAEAYGALVIQPLARTQPLTVPIPPQGLVRRAAQILQAA